ncbi:MAG: T9SS type A sorting domain-containing protein, partial [Bacteroidales bacterium]|nr:T9SS type A sorting domain-containing protein [Bacteroidales bacterium]
FNGNGQVVYRGIHSSEQNSIYVGSLKKGIYYTSIILSNTVIVKKIIIE